MRRLPKKALIAILVIVVLVVAFRFLFKPKPTEVEVTVAGRGPVEDIVTNSEAGTIEPRARARLGAERAGRVTAIHFEEGRRARRGDVLVQLDASTATMQLAAARRETQALEAALEVTRIGEKLARQGWERIKVLHPQGVATDAERDESQARLESADAELKAAEARVASGREAVRLAADEVAHLAVRAPFDGVVARHLVEDGESVIPGQPVIELLATDRVFASAPMDERDAGSLKVGLPARVTLDAYPGVRWPARVTRVAPMVEELKEQNRTLEIEADLDSMDSRPTVRPGMTADIEIILRREEGVLRVPAAAVLESKRVLLAVNGVARSREFEPGLRNWEWVEVRSGLAEGDRIITSLDRTGLRDGTAIRVTDAKQPGKP